MYSNECFIFHKIYERIKSSAVPLILVFIGFSLLYFIFRKRIVKRLLPKENAACKNCQQSNVQQKDEEKKTQFVQKSIDSNAENAMSTPSRSKPIPLPRSARIKLDDDLPPPSTTATSNFLDQTYSVSKFSTSTPIVRKSSTVFESPMKSDVKMPLSPILKSRKPASESPLVHFNESFSSSNPCASNITPKRTLPNIHQNFSPKSQEKSMNFNILKESNQPGINEIKIDGTVSLNELIENILFPGKMNDNNNDEKENV